jgi:hypothetical protein
VFLPLALLLLEAVSLLLKNLGGVNLSGRNLIGREADAQVFGRLNLKHLQQQLPRVARMQGSVDLLAPAKLARHFARIGVRTAWILTPLWTGTHLVPPQSPSRQPAQ